MNGPSSGQEIGAAPTTSLFGASFHVSNPLPTVCFCRSISINFVGTIDFAHIYSYNFVCDVLSVGDLTNCTFYKTGKWV